MLGIGIAGLFIELHSYRGLSYMRVEQAILTYPKFSSLVRENQDVWKPCLSFGMINWEGKALSCEASTAM